MSLSINSNITSLSARRNLSNATSSLGKTFARLSSGLRVNSAADDAAGLSIASKMTAQIRGANQAVRNTNDAISLIQVADGALEETTSALQRMRELSVQAASDTLTTSDRSDLQTELHQLISEINRISADTEFNGQNLLGGSAAGGYSTAGTTAFKFMIGADAGQTIDLTINAAAASTVGILLDGTNLHFSATGAETGASFAASAITTLDTAIASISDIRATLGATQNRLESAASSLTNMSENTESARSRIMDADIAEETSNLTRNSILQQAGTAVLAQANQQPQLALMLLR
ncbi:MAG: flagellin FliC [Magnetococcales bacterium]|nr:flagellin FliC [Magnetococcales bacterium]